MRGIVYRVCVLVIVSLLLAGCAADATHPAVTAIAELLQLRRDDVRDPEAYEPYFTTTELAAELASGSSEPTGTPQVPEYDPPYLAEETTSTADVAVVWRADEAFPDWPEVTVFILSLSGDRWVVVDALEATSAPAPADAPSR